MKISKIKKHIFQAVQALTLATLTIIAIAAFPTKASAEIPDSIRIGLTREFANRETINIANNYITVGHESGGVFYALQALTSTGGFTARVTGGVVTIHAGGTQVFSFNDTTRGAQVVDTAGGTIRLGNYSYRGAIEFHPTGGRLTAINVLCPELYLYGVLPTEMSHHFHANALKAQAIASRTFMVYRMNEGSHRHLGFDLCDTTHCQSYRGTGSEHSSTTQAVSETRGLVMFHSGAVILAVYHSSGGGSTDNSENVWVQARPYLRAVRNIAEHDPVEWTRTFTWAQINTALQAAGASIGTATGIAITQTGTYGRVQELTVHGTGGTWRLTREATRTFFAPIGGTLMSRNFHIAGAAPTQTTAPEAVWVTDGQATISSTIISMLWQNHLGQVSTVPDGVYVFDGTTRRRIESPIPETPTQVVTGGAGITLVGSGWGHGLGMSQRGAHGMALAGHTYREILLHYYTGIEIR